MDSCARCCWGIFVGIYDRTEGQTHYIANLRQNHTVLTRSRDELITIGRMVQERVNNGVANLQEETWLRNARQEEAMLKEILGSEEAPARLPTECLYCCEDCREAYEFGKRLAQALERVDRLVAAGRGFGVSIQIPAAVGLTPEVEMIGMEAKINEFWQLFEDENVPVIGIHGMIGIGKSALLIHINNQLLNNNRGFDRVIWVPSSSNQDNISQEILRIQEAIGDRLGLSFTANTVQEERGRIISRALSGRRFVLLLDNLVNGLPFQALGVPRPNSQNQCKLVFTARMKGMWRNIEPRQIELDLLTQEAARRLLKQSAGLDCGTGIQSDASVQTINDKANAISDMCAGLPLALVVIGQHMQNKSLQEWVHTSERLSNPEEASPDAEERVYADLSVGYQSLKDRSLENESSKQKCFLYPSLFPQRHPIEGEELIHYWMAEGFLGNYNQKLSESINCGGSILEDLKRAHLFMSNEGQSAVQMHHQIYNTARWIASGRFPEGRQKKFFVQSGELQTLPQNETWPQVERISLVGTSIRTLNRIECPNLSTLILKNGRVGKISSNFFDSMEQMKVLDLSHCNIRQLPQGIVRLTTLQYLNLSHSNILSLPDQLKNLKQLKFLDLSFTEILEKIPPGVLKNLTNLRLLNMYYCALGERKTYSLRLWGSRASLDELKGLQHLEDLGVTVKSRHDFKELEVSPKLNCTHSILITKYEDKTGTSLQLSYISCAKSLKQLHITDCTNLVSLQLPQTASPTEGYFENLRNVEIRNCLALKDLTWLRYAQALEELKIEYCPQLREVISGGSSSASPGTQQNPMPLPRLKNLDLRNLPELTSVYVRDLPFTFQEEITVLNCPKLKRVPLNANRAQGTWIRCQKKWWEDMEVDAETKSRFSPVFNSRSYS